MGQSGTYGGGEDADNSYPRQRREVYETEAVGGEGSHGEAVGHVTHGAGKGNREAYCRGGADGVMQ